MNTFKSSAELKASAKERMFGHYGTAVGAVLITLCIVGFLDFITFLFVDTTTVVGTVFYYVISFLLSLLSGLFTSGTTYLYLEIICGRPASVGDICQPVGTYETHASLFAEYNTLGCCFHDIEPSVCTGFLSAPRFPTIFSQGTACQKP